MEELTKTCRVVSKLDHDAPHQKVVVLDGTVGQNAHSQLKALMIYRFNRYDNYKVRWKCKRWRLYLTEKFEIPIHAVGVGEGLDDLQIFEASSFSKALAGLASDFLVRLDLIDKIL